MTSQHCVTDGGISQENQALPSVRVREKELAASCALAALRMCT